MNHEEAVEYKDLDAIIAKGITDHLALGNLDNDNILENL